MAFQTVRFAVDDGVARITLDRPERHNAYNVQMRDDLFEVFTTCALHPALTAVVVDGRGPSFCAGADLSEFGTAPSPFEARRIRFARDVWRALGAIRVPVIALLHGHVVGSGLEMALLCDVRVAHSRTRIVMPEAMLGLLPAATGTQTLPRTIGPNAAAGMLLLGDPLSAEDAFRVGLVDRVTDELAATADALVERWRRDTPARIAAVKASLHRARHAARGAPPTGPGSVHRFHLPSLAESVEPHR